MRFLLAAFIFLIALSASAEISIADISTNQNWNGMPDFVQAPDTWQWSVSPNFFFWMGAGIATGCAMYGFIVRAFKDITDTNVD